MYVDASDSAALWPLGGSASGGFFRFKAAYVLLVLLGGMLYRLIQQCWCC